MPDPQTTGVILLGRGSSDAGANGELAKMARWLFEDNDRAGGPGLHRRHLAAAGERRAAPGAPRHEPDRHRAGVSLHRRADGAHQGPGGPPARPVPADRLRAGTHFGFDKGVFELLDGKVAGLELPEAGCSNATAASTARPPRPNTCTITATPRPRTHDHGHHHATPSMPEPAMHANTVTEQLTAAGRAIEHDSSPSSTPRPAPRLPRRRVAAGAPDDPRQRRLRVQRPAFHPAPCRPASRASWRRARRWWPT